MPSIIAAIEQQERLANSNGALAEERQRALDLYLGRPYGDEQDGRSKVVMRDVADTIEWIKPSLVKVFCAGDEVARFEPVGPEDEDQATQETGYINHCIMQKNDGFQIFYDWFHDALLQKNGYVFVRNCEERVSNREQYKGLTDDEFAMLMQGDEIELLEHTAYPDPIAQAAYSMPVQAAPTAQPPEVPMYHDAVVRKVGSYRYLKIINVPPERVLIASDWPSLNLKGCPFVELIDWKTISDLRNEGHDVPDDISDTAQYSDDEYEEQQREVETLYQDRRDLGADPATRRVKVRYVWLNYDADGDGIAELRHLVVVGKTALNGDEGEEDDIIPAACLCPIRMPHEHNGQSIADIVEDLQRIRTVLTRGFLDNMYLANNGRNAIDASRVNLDDMLTSRPGGVVRVEGDPNGSIMPLIHPQVGSDILGAIEYIDSVRENRTGVTRYNQGIDANSLNKTATGISQIMGAAQQRIELIARLFAETGVKNLMLIVHAMSLKFTRQAEMIKLRNKWIPIDPQTWKTRRDMTVSVGLGTGNKDQMLQHLMLILQAQKEAIMIGAASPENIYNALVKLTQNAGFKNAEEFWTNPAENPPPPPPPDPQMVKAQLDSQAKQQDMQLKAVDSEREFAHKERMAQLEERMKQLDLLVKQQELQLKQREMGLRAQEIGMQAEESQIRMQESHFKAAQPKEQPNEVSSTLNEIKQALTEVLGSQAVGFEKDANGRISGIKRRNGAVTKVLRNQDGKIENIH